MYQAPKIVVPDPAHLPDTNANSHIQAPYTLPIKKAEEYWHMLGPGLTTGAADDDPSGIATYSQAGSSYGFQFLWLASFTFPLMSVVQEMCARIGLVTGRGLAANTRRHFPPWVLYSCTLLLLTANVFNIGADLGAMAQAMQLLMPAIPFSVLLVAFTVLSLGLQIFTSYKTYAKYLKWLALILLSYVLTGFIINLDWNTVLRNTVIPSVTFSRESILLITAILGTTISPYLFFWQTSQEVEEQILAGKTTVLSRQGTTTEEVKNMRIDVWSGMFISNLVMFFIIVVCGATLHAAGITNITTAAEAAEALKPLAGQGAYLLFALGIIGTGLLAVPVLAGSASYALSEARRWKEGLYRPLSQAHAFYGVIAFAMFIGLLINFTNLDPIKALIYSAIANGIIAPVVLVLIVLLASNKKVMGPFANGLVNKILGWIVTLLMTVASLATMVLLFY